MSRKHDPPNKAALLAQDPRIESTVELMVAAAEAQFPPKVKADSDASRARERDNSEPSRAHGGVIPPHPNLRRGRPRAVTAARAQLICDLIGKGETERSACIRAGISVTASCKAKRANATLRERVSEARDNWARSIHIQDTATRYESQIARAAGRKAIPPHPTKQAKWVCHYLEVMVPPNLVAIPQSEIEGACARCNLSLESWQRQERAFGLLRKVYQQRCAIRGQQPPIQTAVPMYVVPDQLDSDDPFDQWRA